MTAFGSSPFSAFTKSLSQDKKKPFMEVPHGPLAQARRCLRSLTLLGGVRAQLMKKLRGAKVAPGSKDEKKKSMVGLDVEIHKLLGSEYKRYRSVQVPCARGVVK